MDETEHRKRLAQILRYIAGMHMQDESSALFVRTANPKAPDFFPADNEDVLFTTQSFKELVSMQAEYEGPQPFSFYAAAAQPPTRKRTFGGYSKKAEKACWLRMTRTSIPTPPNPSSAAVKDYLNDWLNHTPRTTTLNALLTTENIEQHAPDIPTTAGPEGSKRIKSFLRQYKKFLRLRSYQQILEPIYNSLFEWVHGTDFQLVWGLGHARLLLDDGTLVNGPLLEVLVEVELARDGALLLRPREHTGVTLHRQVISSIAEDPQALYKMVAEIEPISISPGQPSTYIPLLKQMAVQLRGRVQASSSEHVDVNELVLTEAWCLWARPKPTSVWARDALTLADRIVEGSVNLPLAAWSLTHGPGSIQQVQSHQEEKPWWDWIQSAWKPEIKPSKPKLALPASASQYKIAELLLEKNCPAVVCEGPPGTGKTQTIANIVCAYLCQGKRVLVTSKNAPALSVLRNRLPSAVREVCVDVSMSESAGMRQLQQTVERLANRVASCDAVLEGQRFNYLQKTIEEHEAELEMLDTKIGQYSLHIRDLVNHPDGQQLIELSTNLVDKAPWLMTTIASWSPKQVANLKDRVVSVLLGPSDPVHTVTGLPTNYSAALISLCATRSGSKISQIRVSAREVMASLPMIGPYIAESTEALEALLTHVQVNGHRPQSAEDWAIVHRAFINAADIKDLREAVWGKEWPPLTQELLKDLCVFLDKAVIVKQLAWRLNVYDLMKLASECRKLDAKRSVLANTIQSLAVDLVNTTVVAELSRSFPVEAQSALIKFSQVAGKAKFSKASQPSRMSQRQRRKRQEYLDAFDKCCRFIPCWILTASQISDYLPPECLFDLVVIDETSQSDVTVLPGMLRGKQWLVVGDGKQVSPTENFIAETEIESLRAALPSCPLEDSLLPGCSFFDLCAQAFPTGRVVLNEHFRCASEIISFSNHQFYDGNLIPLRLPKQSEKLTPSLVDVRVDGEKVKRTNEKEADEIVRIVEELAAEQIGNPRSIGIISLMGDEQSRLIRGRLLDANGVGPQGMARHDIIVGDPPAFQGAERDGMFHSEEDFETYVVNFSDSALYEKLTLYHFQSQLMHFQRANVALSRARDKMILVRSLDISDVPNEDDVKIPIMEFFEHRGEGFETEPHFDSPDGLRVSRQAEAATALLSNMLSRLGYSIRSMGVVWKGALCVENKDSDTRASIMLDCAVGSTQDWKASYIQQKAIERVGWKCLRIDVLSFLTDTGSILKSISKYLESVGVAIPEVEDEESFVGDEEEEVEAPMDDQVVNLAEDEDATMNVVVNFAEVLHQNPPDPAADPPADEIDVDGFQEEGNIVVISSDDEKDRKPSAKPDSVPSNGLGNLEQEGVDPSQFGAVVDLGFLKIEEGFSSSASAAYPSRANDESLYDDGYDEDEYQADQESDNGESPQFQRKRHKRGGTRKNRFLASEESDEEEALRQQQRRMDEDEEESMD